MKTSALLATLSLVACAGQPFESLDPDPAVSPSPAPSASEPLTSSAPPQLMLLHRCDGPSCAVAARHPSAPALPCHDGVARPSCPVASVVWPAPPPDALLALSLAPRRNERLAVQGLFRPDGSLEVASVLAREGEGRLGRLLMASASTCEGDGCLPLQITPLDGRDPWAEPWLDADQAPGDPTHRNLALARAHSPQGTLLTGIRRGRGAARHLEISDYFLEIPLTPTLCGDDLTRAIAQASAGLLWPSESDEPIAPFLAALDGEVPLDGPQLLALLQLPLSTPLETRAMAAFDFNGHSTPGMDAGELAQAARFRALRAALEANLSGVTSYYVGAVDVTVLVVGRSRCGELAGIRTTAVET